jgi:hemoglobin/transferrin/lactoferrin receptor protein
MRNKFIIGIAGLCISNSLYAQTDTSAIHPVQMNEFVISANKFSENKKNIAQPIQLITKKEMVWAMPQTSATLLEQTGNVFVQKSQAGGGSAAIRGFEASRILTVVDGVRMNNAIYRAGHLQNLITVDNNILNSIEVLSGPASTLFGSDALGGVLLLNTKNPILSNSRHMLTKGSGMVRYSSANMEGTAHADINLGFKKIASLTSVTYSKFGDMRSGNIHNPFYDSFGKRYNYIDRINGMDSIVANNDRNIQKYSGYTQIDLLEKILFRQSNHVSHLLNLQYSTSSDIPRYDRLTDLRTGKLRFAEWYYGPQERLMAAYQLNATGLNGFVDDIKAGVNYQAIEESRHQRERAKTGLQSRIEHVDVVGYNIDLRKFAGRNEITFGTDGQYNKVRSNAHTRDINTGKETPLDTRYPNGGATMYYGAVYAQHFLKIIEDKLILNDGLRYNYTSLNATFKDTSFFPFPFSTAEQQHNALSGNLGLVYMPNKKWRFSACGSTGFRSPNVDDLAKVFESSGGVNLMVPNPNLKPEYTYNADLGINYIAGKVLKVEVNGFYTWLRNAIVTDKFTLNGQDTVLYNGKLTAIVASQNKAEGYLYGFNAAITVKPSSSITLYSTLNHTYGRYINVAGLKVPLDHVPPTFGKTSIMYDKKHFAIECYALYNGWKRVKDYSPSGEDNLVYATSKGMPAWYTLNLKLGYRFSKEVMGQIGMENILDQHYRVFASGISAPGRNMVISVRADF